MTLKPDYYTPDGTPLRCDCEPPRVPTMHRGREAAEKFLAARLPLPPRASVEYVAACPDWPDGCGWIEATYRVRRG